LLNLGFDNIATKDVSRCVGDMGYYTWVINWISFLSHVARVGIIVPRSTQPSILIVPGRISSLFHSSIAAKKRAGVQGFGMFTMMMSQPSLAAL
jgi:hypothetical protein